MVPSSLKKTGILVLCVFLGKESRAQRRQFNDVKSWFGGAILELRVVDFQLNVLYAMKNLSSYKV